MSQFQVTILGCGSAMPTTLHNPPSQLVNMNGKLFMIDCGEGTQLQMRKFKARMSKLQGLFISHLHGDHFFGLPGLITTLSMLGRTSDLNIYAHEEIRLMLNLAFVHWAPYAVQDQPNPAKPRDTNCCLRMSPSRQQFPAETPYCRQWLRFEMKNRPAARFAQTRLSSGDRSTHPRVDLLYHEATFAESERERAAEMYHSPHVKPRNSENGRTKSW